MKSKKMFSIDYREREVRRAIGTLPLTGNFTPQYFIEDDLPHETINTELIEDLVEINTAEDIVSEKEFNQVMQDCLDSLTPREAKVLRLRFGIGIKLDMTLEDVAKIMHLTRERIRQIEAKAMRKMRHPARSDSIKMYLSPHEKYSSVYDAINEPPPDWEEYKEWGRYDQFNDAMVAWNERVKKAKKRLDYAMVELYKPYRNKQNA